MPPLRDVTAVSMTGPLPLPQRIWQSSSTTTPPSSLGTCACIYLGHVWVDECANTFLSVGTGMQMPQSTCGGQKTPFRCQPSPFYPDWGSFSTAAQAKLAGPQAPLILLPQPLSWTRWYVQFSHGSGECKLRCQLTHLAHLPKELALQSKVVSRLYIFTQVYALNSLQFLR